MNIRFLLPAAVAAKLVILSLFVATSFSQPVNALSLTVIGDEEGSTRVCYIVTYTTQKWRRVESGGVNRRTRSKVVKNGSPKNWKQSFSVRTKSDDHDAAAQKDANKRLANKKQLGKKINSNISVRVVPCSSKEWKKHISRKQVKDDSLSFEPELLSITLMPQL